MMLQQHQHIVQPNLKNIVSSAPIQIVRPVSHRPAQAEQSEQDLDALNGAQECVEQLASHLNIPENVVEED